MQVRLVLESVPTEEDEEPSKLAEIEPIRDIIAPHDPTSTEPVRYADSDKAVWLEDTLRQIVAFWGEIADELFGDLPIPASASFDPTSGLRTDLSYGDYELPPPPQDPQAVFRVRWAGFQEEQLFLTCATPNLGGPLLLELAPCEPGERCIPKCEDAPKPSEWPNLSAMTWEAIYLVRYQR